LVVPIWLYYLAQILIEGAEFLETRKSELDRWLPARVLSHGGPKATES
jgi:hypothetical protein